MTTIANPRTLPSKDTPTPEDIPALSQVIEVVRRSNHATAYAGWTVTTIAMGLVIQVGTLRLVESFLVTSVLMGLLIPVLAATVRTGLLLLSAGRAVSVVGGDGELTGAAADAGQSPADLEAAHRQARDRLRSITRSAQVRDARARRALLWAYGAGAAFLAWSLAVVLLASQ